MAADALVELDILAREKMTPYIDNVGATIEKFAGRYIARPGPAEVVEGAVGQDPLKLILEFPDMKTAREWYDSPDYRAMLPKRLENSKGNFLFVEGA